MLRSLRKRISRELLAKRALTKGEAEEVLRALVKVLIYLHGKGLAHCHIKPSNLLANDERMELSSDTIFPSGFSRKAHRDMDAYDAPEQSGAAAVMATLPADIWSLGITLVETLTQQAPALPYDDSAELALASTIPSPFLEIARGCLSRNPEQRWTIEEIAARTRPDAAACSSRSRYHGKSEHRANGNRDGSYSGTICTGMGREFKEAA